MGKRLCTAFCLVLAFCFRGTAADTLSLNSGWRFRLCEEGVVRDCSAPSFDDSGWRLLDVPHDWSIEGRYDKGNPSGPQGGYMPCGTAWYRKSFTLGNEYAGKRITLRFDGVYMDSETWVNGRMVGRYPNGYNSFEYDITPFVKTDGSGNVIAVKVDNSLQPGSRWYTGSGIYRDVKLLIDNQMHFIHDATFARTARADEELAVVDVDCRVTAHAYPETRFSWTDNTSLYVWTRNDESTTRETQPDNRVKKQCEVRFTLFDGESAVASASESRVIGDFTENDFRASLRVESPKLWSSSSPSLYTLVCELFCEGSLMDRQQMRVGLREIRFDNVNGMTVNGKREKLRGICLHQNASCFGSAVPVEVWDFRLKQLKETGCNAIRLSHYPFAPFVYELCDELGIYVTNEIFDEWNRGQEWGLTESPYGKMPYSYYRFFDQWHETDLRKMIRRDRNHACVIMYVLGNEIPNQRIKGKEIARELIGITREEDPTRPVTAACDFFVGANAYGFMDLFDIAGYNYIDRIHKDSLYMAEHARYPDRIILGTETYHNPMNNATINRTDAAVGEFIWIGYDYLGEIVWPDTRGWDDGIFDVAGFPKAEAWLRKCLWNEEPVVFAGVLEDDGRDFDWSIRPVKGHWNWKGEKEVTVYAYSNCEEVELKAGGRNFGRKKVHADSCCVCWTVPYKAGTLSATAYKGNKKVASWQVETTGEKLGGIGVKRLDRRPDSHLAIFEVDALDGKGRRIPTYSGNFTVEAAGGRVVGIDNGNQYDPEGKKYTSTTEGRFHEGRAIVYVRTEAGEEASLQISAELD
ncbi:MAG: sugar-binding domain-containing protein [Candidatus Cryptobacteroides sp.]